MTEDYTVEPLSTELFPQLVPLMEDVFGGNPQSALFDWKYLRNPAGPAIGYIARSREGEVAAFYGMIPEIYRWGDQRRRIYQSCDTMTHSRHRRRGLFQLLAKQTYATAKEADPGFFAIGFSGPMSTPGFIKMGWSAPFEIPHLFKPALLARIPWPGGRGPDLQTAIPSALAGLMAANDASRPHSKSYYEDFVHWRLSSPAIDYRFLVDDGAYAILKFAPSFVYLLDFWEASPGAGKGVMRALSRETARPGCRGLLTACQAGGRLDKLLRRHFFLRNPFKRGPASETTPFITYGAPPVPQVNSPEAWEITSVDFDSL